MNNQCQKTIMVGKHRCTCELDAGHTGWCGFILGGRSTHFTGSILSNDELQALSDGTLDPKDVDGE